MCSWEKLSGWTFEDGDVAMNEEGVESEGAVEKNIVNSILVLAETSVGNDKYSPKTVGLR